MRPVLMFDIDGTILSRDRQIQETTILAIRNARKNGAYAIINTGRSRAIIPQPVIDIGFDGMICGCGSYIEWQGQVLQNHLIQPDLMKRANQLFADPSIFVAYEGPRSILYKKGSNNEFFEAIQASWQEDENFAGAQPFQADYGEINKFSVYFDDTSLIAEAADGLHPDMYGIPHGSNFMEFILTGLSKASHFSDFLRDIPDAGKIYAFGDSLNDKAMIEEADYGVAMGNATEALKEVADYVTDDIKEDGLAKSLSFYQLIDDVLDPNLLD